MILDIIIWIAVIALAMRAGAWLQRMQIEAQLEDIYEGADEEDDEEELHVTCIVELHQEQMYCWEKENSEFLGQGKTFEDMKEAVKKRTLELYGKNCRISLITADEGVLERLKLENIDVAIQEPAV